jgi:hypothetical protein
MAKPAKTKAKTLAVRKKRTVAPKATGKALVPVKGGKVAPAKPTSRARARATAADRERKKRIFLIVLEKSCNISHAARAAGMDRTTAYDWRATDDDFARRWHEAEEAAVDKLEQVAYERSIKGESDRMLEILLKSHRPHKYVEKQLHAHALTKETQETLASLGMSIDEAAQLYREKLG